MGQNQGKSKDKTSTSSLAVVANSIITVSSSSSSTSSVAAAHHASTAALAALHLRQPLLSDGAQKYTLKSHDTLVETLGYFESIRRQVAEEVITRQLALSERITKTDAFVKKLTTKTMQNVDDFRRYERRFKAG
jgi:exo-beta-1,3-glucanase (GH17 family)